MRATLGAPIEYSAIESEEMLASLVGLKVLYAEDTLLLRELTIDLLENEGMIVTGVENGQLAWEALQEGDFDILLTDYFMPEMDGCQLTEKLRKSGYTKPIIGITAATVGDERSDMVVAGVSAVLEKPIDVDKLCSALRESMGTSSRSNLLQASANSPAKPSNVIVTDRMQ